MEYFSITYSKLGVNFIINKDNFLNKKLKTTFIILIYFISSLYNKNLNYKLFGLSYKNFVKPNKYFLSDYFKNIDYKNDFNFNITNINFSIDSNKNNIKVEYLINFLDKDNNLVSPSDLTLYNKLHILCNLNIINNNINIISLANIYENKYYKCIEFFNKYDKIIFGIKIYKIDKNLDYCIINLFSYEKYSDYKYISQINNIFNSSLINKDNNNFDKIIDKNKNCKNTFKLKESYQQKSFCELKRNILLETNKWSFTNIYNNYFCYCKGSFCLYQNIPQKCKYDFYLNIIDNNKDLYNKTDYLFGDFIFNQYSSDDAFPIFEEMLRQNFPAHYYTQNSYIYNKYCNSNKKCLKIIPVIDNNEIINGDFLEKYLTLILKLKVVITGAEFFSINNLFYNIDYITYINIGHGISYFKDFLYSNYSYYGNTKYNKILIPPSEKLITKAKLQGWNDDDIIKINLPKWYKYDIIKEKNNKKSIFIMFTWREIPKNKSISYDYINNIFNLINNNQLIQELKKNNITLYFKFHHQFSNYISLKKINNYINIIDENEISKVISIANLVVTDFSSIIFDFIYRKKPFVIYIPDSNYSYIKNNYIYNYYKLIKDMKEEKIYFKNKYFNLKETINKIIYYINNDFKLENTLLYFYNSFGLKKENSLIKFIQYIKNIN